MEGFTALEWSPDGKTIALTTSEATKRVRSVLSAISVADGSVREIYSTPDAVGRPRWLPDGSGLLAPISNIDQALRGQLWFISYPRGEARRLTNDLLDYQLCCLDLTPDGKTLVDTELTMVSDLWIASAGNSAKAKQVTAKEFAVGGFSWMPDGRHHLCQPEWQSVRDKSGWGWAYAADARSSSQLGPIGLWRWPLYCLLRLPGTKTRHMAHGCRWLKPHPHR